MERTERDAKWQEMKQAEDAYTPALVLAEKRLLSLLAEVEGGLAAFHAYDLLSGLAEAAARHVRHVC